MLVEAFSVSTRRCTDPVDYVYGVLGIFQFKIPRKTDPHEVWQLSLHELEDYLKDMENDYVKVPWFNNDRITGISDQARQVDLLKAEKMADVYTGLLARESLSDDEG